MCVTDPEGVGDAEDAFSVQNGNIRIAGSPFGYMRTEGDLRRLPASRRVALDRRGDEQRHFPARAGRRPALARGCRVSVAGGARGRPAGAGRREDRRGGEQRKGLHQPRSGGECERPAGEWNCAEIVCVGDHIAVCVNGVLQNECTGSVRSGYIALQSEGRSRGVPQHLADPLETRDLGVAAGGFGLLSSRVRAESRHRPWKRF